MYHSCPPHLHQVKKTPELFVMLQAVFLNCGSSHSWDKAILCNEACPVRSRVLNSISGLSALHKISRPSITMIKIYLQTMPNVPREGQRVTPSWGPLLQGLEWRPEIWVLRIRSLFQRLCITLGEWEWGRDLSISLTRFPLLLPLKLPDHHHHLPKHYVLATDHPTSPGSNPYLFWPSLSGSLSTKVLINQLKGRLNCDRFSLWYLW